MSANDTVLSDRALRRVEADGVVLEHNLETLRKQHDEREEDLGHVSRVAFALEFRLTNLWMR